MSLSSIQPRWRGLAVGVIIVLGSVACAEGRRRTVVVPGASAAPAATTTSSASTATNSNPTNPATSLPAAGTLQAGVGTADITPPVGVPLAGFGGGQRRLSQPMLLAGNLVSGAINQAGQYNTWMAPSTGILDPIMAKAVVLSDGQDVVALCSLDLIATSLQTKRDVLDRLLQLGIPIPDANLVLAASHTHSGPGTMSPKLLWQLITTDDFRPAVYGRMLDGIVQAIAQAYRGLGPARLGIASGFNAGLTKNRRASDSQYLTEKDIDPEIGVIRVDKADGSPLAVVYNFAIHPLAYGESNLQFSADLAAHASGIIEGATGATAIFLNGAEGDISPSPKWINPTTTAGHVLGRDVVGVWQGIATNDTVELAAHRTHHDFGQATIFVGANQLPQVLQGGLSQYSSLVSTINGLATSLGFPIGLPIKLDERFLETRFDYHGIRIGRTLLSTVPGEAIRDLGQEIKQDALALGFERAYVVGLANGHMAYITTKREYREGGYEAIATFFGEDTASIVRLRARECAQALKP